MSIADQICECRNCGNAEGKRYQIETLSTCGELWELEQKCLDCGRTMTIHAIVESVTVTHKGGVC